MTTLYYILFKERMSDDLFAEKLNMLPAGLSEKAQKFWRWQDAHASLFGKLLLLEGFKNFGISADLTDLRFTKYGKPYLHDSPVCFNISHSGNCVVCAMSDEVDSVGVDVEEIKPINIKAFQCYWLDPEWNEIVNGSPTIFYKYWTRKEAILKADGRGIGVPFKEIDVRNAQVFFDQKTYFLNTYTLHCNYILHLAAIKDFSKIDPVCFHMNSFQSN